VTMAAAVIPMSSVGGKGSPATAGPPSQLNGGGDSSMTAATRPGYAKHPGSASRAHRSADQGKPLAPERARRTDWTSLDPRTSTGGGATTCKPGCH